MIGVGAGSNAAVDFDWRSTDKGARIATDYDNWQSEKRSMPKEAWYGIGTGVISAGSFGLAGMNMLLAKQNQDALLAEDGRYQDYVSARDITAAREAFETKDELRVLRNQGIAYAALEVTLGTASAALTAWLFKKVKKKKSGLNEWDINTYASVDDSDEHVYAEVLP